MAIAELQPVRAGRVVTTRSLEEAVGPARWVQENAPENLATKQELLNAIEAATPASTIIASSTSALLWSALAEGMRHPERLIVAHPFNPVHLIPLVELFAPDAALVETAHAFYTAIGKRPVRLRREMEGHIAGRLAAALWREAVHLAASGVASVAEIDQALTDGPGLRWAVQGAHQTYHTGGGPGGLADYLTHLGPSQERRWATLGTPSLDAPPAGCWSTAWPHEAAGRTVPISKPPAIERSSPCFAPVPTLSVLPLRAHQPATAPRSPSPTERPGGRGWRRQLVEVPRRLLGHAVIESAGAVVVVGRDPADHRPASLPGDVGQGVEEGLADPPTAGLRVDEEVVEKAQICGAERARHAAEMRETENLVTIDGEQALDLVRRVMQPAPHHVEFGVVERAAIELAVSAKQPSPLGLETGVDRNDPSHQVSPLLTLRAWPGAIARSFRPRVAAACESLAAMPGRSKTVAPKEPCRRNDGPASVALHQACPAPAPPFIATRGRARSSVVRAGRS